MIRYANLLVLLVVCCGCVTPLYQAVTAESYNLAIRQPNQRRLIFVQSLKLSDQENWVTILNKQKWGAFNRQIALVEDADTREFLHSARLLIGNDYTRALQILTNLPPEQFDCQVFVLKTDCLYQLDAPSVNIKNEYQKALDCTHNETVKSIIKNRYRFVNYGY